MKQFSFVLLLSLILFSCGSNQKINFNININNTKEFLNNGDIIEFSIPNFSNSEIYDVEFTLNEKVVRTPYKLDNKLGKNILKATFKHDEKDYTISKEFTIYSTEKPSLFTYEIINEYSHEITSYTQGLEFDKNGHLFESTGQYGFSTLQKYDYKTGNIINKIFLDNAYFGEGITILNKKIFQLTWKSNIGFIYDVNDFRLIDSFTYNKSIEGWGLCNDGEYLYKSDGSEKIWKLDSNNAKEIDFINVVTNNKVINKINELEWYNNKIYANTYQFNKEVGLIVNPKTGSVEGVIDFTGLKERVKQHPKLDVLNGIAYNSKTKTFFITGKNWNKLFEIKIVKKD